MYGIGDSVNDQRQLTTLKILEESIVEEYGVVKEPNKKDDDDEEKKSITEEDGVAIVAESS